MTLDQLKSYHSDRVDALCPGHPEIEHEGIEVTTGPLGQGVANAVGLAIATKHLAAQFNKPGFDVISNHTWCMIGDACLQEGVGLEAVSLAGHLKLNNLTITYDNNQITCDGSVDLSNTEDINAKMRACGWNVIDIQDGSYDIEGIVSALKQARESKDKPTFINIRTVIGLGSAVAGEAAAHGAAFGAKDVADMKVANGFNPEEHFVISDEIRDFFAECPDRGETYVKDWNSLVQKYSVAHPELSVEFRSRIKGEMLPNWEDLIPKTFPTKLTPTRASSGLVFNPVAEKVKNFLVGTADLSPSVHMIYPGKLDFQNVSISYILSLYIFVALHKIVHN
jgi:dihydroxyacetone synthase